MSDLRAALDAALAARSAELSADPGSNNQRAYICDQPGCARVGYAGGFCNAHYIRSRSGRPMNAPIRNRKSGTCCRVCDRALSGKGGWGMCSRHYRRERAAVIKAVIVAAKGGCCMACHGVFPLPVYDLHHIGVKDDAVAALIQSGSTKSIAAEVEKCVLLCANCHRIEHNP